MKDFLQNLFTLIMAALVIGGFAYWIKQHKEDLAARAKPGDVVDVLDTSSSAEKLSCDAVVAKLREKLADKDFRSARDSRYALIALSGYSTAFEAQLAVELPIPRRGSGPFGKKGNLEGFLNQVREGCSRARQAEGSAIFRSIQIAVNYMKSRNCGLNRTCELSIFSDGLENANQRVWRYLMASAGTKAAPPEILDNAVAVKSSWCGFSQASEQGGPSSNAPELMGRWAAMFTRPVNMQPYCRADQAGAVQARSN